MWLERSFGSYCGLISQVATTCKTPTIRYEKTYLASIDRPWLRLNDFTKHPREIRNGYAFGEDLGDIYLGTGCKFN